MELEPGAQGNGASAGERKISEGEPTELLGD
jgi:hypothetical protein